MLSGIETESDIVNAHVVFQASRRKETVVPSATTVNSLNRRETKLCT